MKINNIRERYTMGIVKVLDIGELELIDSLGSDLTVVNSARVSFGNKKVKFDKKDKSLMKYLSSNKHYSPFRHIILQFRIKAPEFVLRQWYKHVVGSETTSSYPTKDHGWNEISGRYKPVSEYYRPVKWREQSIDNKQASDGLIEDQEKAFKIYDEALANCLNAYNSLLSLGVAKEQARIILPLNQYTEVYWTASFQAIANFIELRDHSHAQWEIREYAKEIAIITKRLFPETFEAWFLKM